MALMIARLSVVIDWYLNSIIEAWCTMVNSITLDFNKTPFKFLGVDFKIRLREFETRLKGLADRREQPQSKT
jgi:hypothetical protein